MKILAASDLHGSGILASRLAERAALENVDVVILCGDITHFDQEAKNILRPFILLNKKVLLIPGNHDTLAGINTLADIYKVKNIHGSSVRYGDVGIFGCGGANIGPHTFLSDNEMLDLLKGAFSRIAYLPKKIMVTHLHPAGSLIERLSFPGGKGLRHAIRLFKPDILFCGHIHECEGLEESIDSTKVVDVGRTGTIIEI
ncbi:metallophosphoesterase family protein [Candidatus Woesearchaeota archaeon]|nr:metallophosphoesterase family protein [Candidatus Woesearchaeota archaeon]